MSRAVGVVERPGGLFTRFLGRLRGIGRQTRPARTEGDSSVTDLADLVREDLRRRYDLGERPTVAEYLDRFPRLRDARQRVISLVYEEYCLRQEQGESLDADSFCARYAPWQDSLVSQLRYHREISRAVSSPDPTPAPPRFPKPGSRFLWFELEAELGRGGAGRVFLARDATLGDRRVALKLTRNPSDEPALLGRLDHPHIVPVTLVEHDPETGLHALCMPYLASRPLTEIIDRVHALGRPSRALALQLALGRTDDEPGAGPPDWPGFPRRGGFADGAAWLAWKLADALAYAHDRGVTHRDIKPANILLTRRAGPMLLDFNLAHRPSEGTPAASAATGGTLPYMAPEHLAAFLDPERWSEVGPAADLYALGLVLRELLTGRRPEIPDSSLPSNRKIAELLDRRQASAPAPARADNPDVPHGLDAILARCLAPRPADRYPDAAALAEDLRRYLRREPLCTVRNPSRRETATNWAYRRRLPLAASVAALTLWGAYNFVVPNDTQQAEFLLNGALTAINHGHLPEARGRYYGALEYWPDWHLAWSGLGTVSLLEGEQAESQAKSESDRGAIQAAKDHGQTAYERFTEGEGFLNRAIASAEKDQLDPAQRAALYRNRAWSRIRLGRAAAFLGVHTYDATNQAHTPASRSAFVRAAAHFQDAFADLAQTDRWERPGTSNPDTELCRASAHLGRGEAASAFDDYQRSVRDFRDADEFARKAETTPTAPPHVREEATKLRQIIKKRLDSDEPKLASLPSETASLAH
jgi:serine/threonine protein kinase